MASRPLSAGARWAPTRRGLQVPGSPDTGAGRSLAQFPGIRRAGKRRLRTQWMRQQRPEGGERAGGRGGGGADVGWSAACQGGGWPGRRLAALGAGFAAGTALAARSRLGERRTEGLARGSGWRSTRRADPRRRAALPSAGPLPGGRPSAAALGARRLPGFNGCSAGQCLEVEAAAAQEGAGASLLRAGRARHGALHGGPLTWLPWPARSPAARPGHELSPRSGPRACSARSFLLAPPPPAASGPGSPGAAAPRARRPAGPGARGGGGGGRAAPGGAPAP